MASDSLASSILTDTSRAHRHQHLPRACRHHQPGMCSERRKSSSSFVSFKSWLEEAQSSANQEQRFWGKIGDVPGFPENVPSKRLAVQEASHLQCTVTRHLRNSYVESILPISSQVPVPGFADHQVTRSFPSSR